MASYILSCFNPEIFKDEMGAFLGVIQIEADIRFTGGWNGEPEVPQLGIEHNEWGELYWEPLPLDMPPRGSTLWLHSSTSVATVAKLEKLSYRVKLYEHKWTGEKTIPVPFDVKELKVLLGVPKPILKRNRLVHQEF